MADFTDVYLITGFLGSGKTTFLNRLIRQFPRNRKLMVLMNEFGEIGVDGTLVAGEDLDILEISKGSIFCACVKTDFIKGLYEIAQKIKPDILLIESTGVANPVDLKKDLNLPIFKGRFQFKEQFCIIDAANFLDAFQVYASVEKQISSSTRFIINKIDLASREQVEEIKNLVKKYHPDPQFYEATYADINVAELLSLEQPLEGARYEPGRPMSEEELERYVEELLSDIHESLTPPDLLMSASFFWKGGAPSDLREMTARLPREVLRVKGFVQIEGRLHLYNYVMGQCTIEMQDVPVKKNQINVLVFIAPPQIMPAVEKLMGDFNFVKTGEINRQEFFQKR
ncbi:CobW family GTP-binding protein [Desulfofundulus thermocisternus]|jgi:G3E family GTPase|uniref:CobW family GTP-binding protein n=1 Tax=Desulfofundulus thermocisternus TaxID=42471 RepID=UPI000487C0F9|nr:CobW family GTP-binding protein [Desulfofundulus thermocisternus]